MKKSTKIGMTALGITAALAGGTVAGVYLEKEVLHPQVQQQTNQSESNEDILVGYIISSNDSEMGQYIPANANKTYSYLGTDGELIDDPQIIAQKECSSLGGKGIYVFNIKTKTCKKFFKDTSVDEINFTSLASIQYSPYSSRIVCVGQDVYYFDPGTFDFIKTDIQGDVKKVYNAQYGNILLLADKIACLDVDSRKTSTMESPQLIKELVDDQSLHYDEELETFYFTSSRAFDEYNKGLAVYKISQDRTEVKTIFEGTSNDRYAQVQSCKDKLIFHKYENSSWQSPCVSAIVCDLAKYTYKEITYPEQLASQFNDSTSLFLEDKYMIMVANTTEDSNTLKFYAFDLDAGTYTTKEITDESLSIRTGSGCIQFLGLSTRNDYTLIFLSNYDYSNRLYWGYLAHIQDGELELSIVNEDFNKTKHQGVVYFDWFNSNTIETREEDGTTNKYLFDEKTLTFTKTVEEV